MELNLSIITLIALTFGLTTACFITNCPPGGKRSAFIKNNNQKQCARCGPFGVGRCFGADICCSATIGCHFKNRLTEICRTENYNPHPCKIDGKSCDNGNGVCALNSTCCTPEGCFIDKNCEFKIIKSSAEEVNEERENWWKSAKWFNPIDNVVVS